MSSEDVVISPRSYDNVENIVKEMASSFEVLGPRYDTHGILLKTGGGMKADCGKPEYDRLSFEALGLFNAVHKFGDSKYEKGNWRKGLHHTRLLNAAIRHIAATLNGEILDSESGLPHTAHAGVCLEMVTHYLQYPEKYKEYNDLEARP